jgi:hypothetical protein
MGQEASSLLSAEPSFSALLHAVSKMTRGRRYAFLPFHDEAAQDTRGQQRIFGHGRGDLRAQLTSAYWKFTYHFTAIAHNVDN